MLRMSDCTTMKSILAINSALTLAAGLLASVPVRADVVYEFKDSFSPRSFLLTLPNPLTENESFMSDTNLICNFCIRIDFFKIQYLGRRAMLSDIRMVLNSVEERLSTIFHRVPSRSMGTMLIYLGLTPR
jgi:hypothetical protein